MYPNKPTNASLSATDRRRREDGAPRLSELIPRLTALSIWVDERSIIASPKYVRRIVVGSAPALFILPCSDQNCSEGGHDISDEVLASLREGRASFSGSHTCSGWIGSSQCRRMIWFKYEAEFASAATPLEQLGREQ